MNTTYCYTNASYHPQAGFAICGYKIGDDGSVWVSRRRVSCIAEAERLAITDCIGAARGCGINGRLVIYTDYKGAPKMAANPGWREQYPNVEIRLLDCHKKMIDKHSRELTSVEINLPAIPEVDESQF